MRDAGHEAPFDLARKSPRHNGYRPAAKTDTGLFVCTNRSGAVKVSDLSEAIPISTRMTSLELVKGSFPSGRFCELPRVGSASKWCGFTPGWMYTRLQPRTLGRGQTVQHEEVRNTLPNDDDGNSDLLSS